MHKMTLDQFIRLMEEGDGWHSPGHVRSIGQALRGLAWTAVELGATVEVQRRDWDEFPVWVTGNRGYCHQWRIVGAPWPFAAGRLLSYVPLSEVSPTPTGWVLGHPDIYPCPGFEAPTISGSRGEW
jgi:hypothetical protein